MRFYLVFIMCSWCFFVKTSKAWEKKSCYFFLNLCLSFSTWFPLKGIWLINILQKQPACKQSRCCVLSFHLTYICTTAANAESSLLYAYFGICRKPFPGKDLILVKVQSEVLCSYRKQKLNEMRIVQVTSNARFK